MTDHRTVCDGRIKGLYDQDSGRHVIGYKCMKCLRQWPRKSRVRDGASYRYPLHKAYLRRMDLPKFNRHNLNAINFETVWTNPIWNNRKEAIRGMISLQHNTRVGNVDAFWISIEAPGVKA